MPEVSKLPPPPTGCRWRPTTAGDFTTNPGRVYKSAYEAIHGGCAYWELLNSQGIRITLPTGIAPAPGGRERLDRPTQVADVDARVTANQLRAIMPTAGIAADRYVEPLNRAMANFGINGSAQRAAFLAQISVESGQLQHTVENLNYSARRLHEVWPQRFPAEAAAAPYAHNPDALANRVYANRLGNGDEASGDGFRFRGRGLMQVTGRDNYRRLGFENNPEALSNPTNAAHTAAAFWRNNGLNGRTMGVVNRAQFDAVSRTINGGNHGLQMRWDAYQRALRALGVGP